MRKGAVIVDNRNNAKLKEVIDAHMWYLPGWELMHVKDVRINTFEDYNRLLTSFKFWKDMPFEKVLIFQHDSALLRYGIDEFLEYDYIGAPIKNFNFPAMNGGLSLRDADFMKHCVLNLPRNSTKYKNHNEDIYFSYICKELGGKLPDKETAMKFSVETIFSLGSLGIHAANKYLTSHQMTQILTQYDR